MATIYDLPEFDTGLYEGCSFGQSGLNAFLTVNVVELGDLTISFQGVRYYQFTSLYCCSPEMVKAYFKLVEVEKSRELKSFLKRDRSSNFSSQGIRHYRIFLDETGCYDVFSESCKVP